MGFWKLFAWIATGWSLLFRGGKGISIRRVSADERAEQELQQSGPGWRRVSTTRVGLVRDEPAAPPESETDGVDP